LSDIKKQYEDVVKVTNDEKKTIQNTEKNIRNKQNKHNNELKSIQDLFNTNDYIRLNIGGQILVTRRSTLTKIPNSKLARWFDLSSPELLKPEYDGSYFLDFDSNLFSFLLDQLRSLDDLTTPVFKLPTSPILSKLFRQMLNDLDLPLPPKSKNNYIILNIGGKRIETTRDTINRLADANLSKSILNTTDDQSDPIFIDYNPKKFYHLLDQARIKQPNKPVTKKRK